MSNNTEQNKTAVNLKYGQQLSFKDLIQHGIDNGANIIDGMPWSWKINGKSVTHENNNCYIIETIDGYRHLHHGDVIQAVPNGLVILRHFSYDTHAPGGCPM
jgi:hypothetical protein